MSERILICVAWPYANGSVHVGQIAGCFLPADIFARYHRMKGNEVLMVSGSDQHGTPVTIKAEAEGKTPKQIVDFYHQEFLDTWRRFGITFNLFTTTDTVNHAQVAQDVFLKLLEKDYIYKDTVSQAFCEKCQRFLPDRYVEGTCPICAHDKARGDQCDNCGALLDPIELKNPYSVISGSRDLEVRETREVLQAVAGVQNTYLSAFAALGGLGLLLGTVGLAAALLRAAVERRRELARRRYLQLWRTDGDQQHLLRQQRGIVRRRYLEP